MNNNKAIRVEMTRRLGPIYHVDGVLVRGYSYYEMHAVGMNFDAIITNEGVKQCQQFLLRHTRQVIRTQKPEDLHAVLLRVREDELISRRLLLVRNAKLL